MYKSIVQLLNEDKSIITNYKKIKTIYFIGILLVSICSICNYININNNLNDWFIIGFLLLDILGIVCLFYYLSKRLKYIKILDKTFNIPLNSSETQINLIQISKDFRNIVKKASNKIILPIILLSFLFAGALFFGIFLLTEGKIILGLTILFVAILSLLVLIIISIRLNKKSSKHSLSFLEINREIILAYISEKNLDTDIYDQLKKSYAKKGETFLQL